MTLPSDIIRLKSLVMSHTADLPLKVSPEQYTALQDQGLLRDPQLSERIQVDE